MTYSRRMSGFTLVELLVVIMILGIAAAVVLPSFGTTSDLQAVSGAKLLAADLQYAQSQAITTQANIKVIFQLDPVNSYKLTGDNESVTMKHPITKKDYEVVFANQDGLDRLRVMSASFAGVSKVKFDATGAPDNPGSILLQAGTRQYRVDISTAVGRVSVTAL